MNDELELLLVDEPEAIKPEQTPSDLTEPTDPPDLPEQAPSDLTEPTDPPDPPARPDPPTDEQADISRRAAELAAASEALNKERAALAEERAAFERERAARAVERKLENALARANVRRVDMVKALLDPQSLQTDENGDFVDLNERLQAIAQEAPGLFNSPEKPVFTGSTGNFRREAADDTADNPWKPSQFNLTRQGEIYRKDPALAGRLMAGAR